jgi:hypothetical protein
MRLVYPAVLAAVLLFASPAGAGRSGATLTFEPNAAPAWSWAHGSGCGYAVGSQVYVDVQKPEALMFLSTAPDARGCIAFQFTTDGPGTYLVQARQRLRGNKWTVMASYQLPVA